PAGTFIAAYDDNRADAVESVIDSDPVAAAVRALLGNRADWSGTATDLLELLGQTVGEKITRSKSWPADARALSGRLKRAATFLRKVGIEVEFSREGRGRRRVVRLASVASAAAATPPADDADDADADRAHLREERAAIRQYDGGLSRHEAERLADS